MDKRDSIVLPRVVMAVTAFLCISFTVPSLLWAQGKLENPQASSFQSGLGVISGWVCNASRVDLVIDEVTTLEAAYGTDRGDTVTECGDSNNGFGLLLNWNLLGDGTHTMRALADGIQFGSATFTVTTIFGVEYLNGVDGSCRLTNFPWSGFDTVVSWEESLQNFVIESIEIQAPGVGGVGIRP